MEIIALIVGWIVFSHVFAEVVPVLLEGLGCLIGFLFLCLWEVLKFTLRAVLWLLVHMAIALVWAARVSRRGLYLGCLFLFYLADEWRRGSQDMGAAEEEFSGAQSADENQAADAYEQALALLGLAPGFTQTALKRAYRAAIRTAHPDAGGTEAAAQAINSAYELILHAHDWAR